MLVIVRRSGGHFDKYLDIDRITCDQYYIKLWRSDTLVIPLDVTTVILEVY